MGHVFKVRFCRFEPCAAAGGGVREGSDDETYEEVLEERTVYHKDGRKKGRMVIVNMVTVHKSVQAVAAAEPVGPLGPFDLSVARTPLSRSSSRDSLSSPKSWRKSFVGTGSQFDVHIEEIKSKRPSVR